MAVRRCRRGRRGRPFAWGPLALAGILIFLFVMLDLRMRPYVEAVSANAAKAYVVDVVHDAVLDELDSEAVSFDSLVQVQRSADGAVQAVSSNVQQQNRLQARLVQAVQKAAGSQSHSEVSIPIGTLTGSTLLHGRGPGIPLKLTFMNAVDATLQSSFDGAGVNQTRHRLVLHVTASVYTYLPGKGGQQEISVEVPVAETVIAGEVPSVALQSRLGT